MDSRPTTAESKHTYQQPTTPTSWTRLSSSTSTPRLPSSTAAATVPLPESPVTFPAAQVTASQIPILFPHHPAIYQAQLLNYNKLISPSRGGGVGIQTQPLPPVLSAPYVQATGQRSRSSSKSHYNTQNGQNSQGGQNSQNGSNSQNSQNNGSQTGQNGQQLNQHGSSSTTTNGNNNNNSSSSSSNSSSNSQQQQQKSSQTSSNQNCHGSKNNKNADKPDRSVTKMGKDAGSQKSAQKSATSGGGKQQKGGQQKQGLPNQQSSNPQTDSSQPGPQSSQQNQQGQQKQPPNNSQPSSSSTLHVNSDRPRSNAPSSSRPHGRPSKSPRPHPKAPLTQASSVPSTPHQHARNFSFESRDPSPNTTQNHSPRSAYSETNTTLPSLRPLPPRYGGCIYETALVRGRRRMPYSLGADPLESVNLDKIKARLSKDEAKQLSTDMRELYDRLRPNSTTQDKRERFIKKLEKMFNDEWPDHNIRVHIFGSSGNRLCSDDSDVDICITTDWKEMENVCMIAELLAKRGMEKVVCVSSAKVPIVKIWDPELSLACDMNVNNTLALENTRMVLTYIGIDDRVRPLAMIIKYWTRRRIINDAAFGGTLSSYTWICMVICFLQLRQTPILPALHQRPDEKLPRPDGTTSEFADDLDKLAGFGKANKESLGELLFHFFRFYAYEFDYSKNVLSVRLGKLTTKTEKKWHTMLNNMLCVEEPFNTVRNLGNTADDTSFRGLHMELRRAFDLIAEGKLSECCDEYVFPKEEERVFQKPAQTPRPVLLRSSSQQQPNQSSGRGGRGGGFRGGRQFRSGNNSRRASSSVAYENNPIYLQAAMMPTMTPQEMQWYHQQAQQAQQVQHVQQQQAAAAAAAAAAQQQQQGGQAQSQQQQQQQQQTQQAQYVFHPDMLSSPLTALQMQQVEQSLLRIQYYTNPQAYVQQQHALAHAHRIQQAGTTSATDRSRTNSFDNPPLSAPLRPDLYMYMPLQPAPYYVQPAGFSTLPSSPSATTAPSEFRRSLHRTATAPDSLSPTGGTLRSQSQPASRSPMPGSQSQGNLVSAGQVNGSTTPSFARSNANGISMPSFIPDETADSEADETPSKRPTADSRSTEEDRSSTTSSQQLYANGYCLNEGSASPTRFGPMPSFGDLAPSSSSSSSLNRRRLSTDQLPQTILGRRMRRASSRSPSPLGHNRAYSSGNNTAPLPSGPFLPVTPNRPGNKETSSSRSALVVNGSATRSNLQGSMSLPSESLISSRQPSTSDSVISEDAMSASSSLATSSMETSSYLSHGLGISGMNGSAAILPDQTLTASPTPYAQVVSQASGTELGNSTATTTPVIQSPLIVNGSTSAVMSSPVHHHSHHQHLGAHTSPVAPDTQSFGQRIAAMNGFSPVPYAAVVGGQGGMPVNGISQQMSPSPRQRMTRQQQRVIAPLDLAMPDQSLVSDMQHLSPVYEHRTPSPTAMRKFDSQFGRAGHHQASGSVGGLASATTPTSSSSLATHVKNARKDNGQQAKSTFASKGNSPDTATAKKDPLSLHHRVNGTTNGQNGHARASKSESGETPAPASAPTVNAWQKPKTRKKTADLKAMANGQAHGEQMPKNESERKGG